MKSKKRNRASAWTAQDHAMRDQLQQEKKRKKKSKVKSGPSTSSPVSSTAVATTGTESHTSVAMHRRAVLTHETQEKKDSMKLRLHITKTKRMLEVFKKRLMNWDPQEEKERRAKEERQRAEEERDVDVKKKSKRKGPETWKLRGAARPAHEVYDFDTRYVDPYVKEHQQAKEKASRTVNLLALYKGRFASETQLAGTQEDANELSIEVRREYLSLLMQLGHLSEQAKKYKTARASWLECVDLEGDSSDHNDITSRDSKHGHETDSDDDGDQVFVTTAREDLMRMYMKLGRHEAALRLGERLCGGYLKKNVTTSVWVSYSLALVNFKLRGKDEKAISTETCIATPTESMMWAIKSNPFCAYYLAFYDTFSTVIEYTDDLHDSGDGPQTSFEEAIEYCSSGQGELWCKSGANLLLRDLLIQTKRSKSSTVSAVQEHLSVGDVSWEERLSKIEEHYRSLQTEEADPSAEESDSNFEEVEEEVQEQEGHVDVLMYAGMFRTAMEMIEDSGQI